MTHMSHGDFERRAESYHRFMLGMKWVLITMATSLVFLVTCFATSAGFLPALVLAAIVLAVGVWAMNHGLAHSTERDHGAGL